MGLNNSMSATKFKVIFFIFSVLVLVGACSNSDSQENLYQEGTYTAESSGHNGLLTVEVTVSQTEILEIEVIGHDETAGLADPAIERIPEAVVSEQSLEVDMISGATITSEAVIEAISECIAEASID